MASDPVRYNSYWRVTGSEMVTRQFKYSERLTKNSLFV